MANLGQSDFNARVKRIKKPGNTSYYDPELQMHVPKRVTRSKIKVQAEKREFTFSKFLVSMVIGATGVACAQILRVRYFGLNETGNLSLAVDLLCAVWAALLLSAFMKHRVFPARMAQICGVVAMMIAGHNLVWRFPEQMAMIYTDAFVTQVQAETVPQSLVFRDIVISL